MTLKVIGAGFGRTGTLSMKAALETLGYDKCHHMMEVFADQKQADLWYDISQGGEPDWDHTFDGFQACVDFPACIFYKELAEKYPDAKVVLTTRDPESWYASAESTIYQVSRRMPGWLARVVPLIRKMKPMLDDLIWKRVFNNAFENREAAIAVFKAHEAEVKAVIPEDRLLVMHVKEGWGPLCSFLGVPEPDVPFPNVNDKADFEKRIRIFTIMNYLPHALAAILVCAALWIGYSAI
ncbi:sulfotransferase family protein [Ponticaulis profundi]|uniref:Sulfotransferase family protein n=1 Tax=Ponticaulis profundi TaxID=2665222 RepID=A0ABW1S829_9PROT